MQLARELGRAIVTDNVADFRPRQYEAILPGGAGHLGMIFLPGGYRRRRDDFGRIVEALVSRLAEHPADDDLANAEIWLSDVSARG